MLKQLRPAVMSVVILTILTGFVFPLFITVIAQAAFPHQAKGSLITQGGKVIGSELIGQTFTAPGYFHPRPSAAGAGYDAANSSGTNLGPTSSKQIQGIKDDPKTPADESYAGIPQLAKAYRTENGLPESSPLPADAVTRSASGLDPHISPANAGLQAGRVAKQRGLSADAVNRLIVEATEGRQLGFLGEPRVNVLKLNLALDSAAPGRAGKAAQKK